VLLDVLHRAETRVMSCRAKVVVVPPEGLGDDEVAEIVRSGIERLHQLEHRWSRFLPGSEISGLNRAGGGARSVTQDTIRLVDALRAAWRATDGAFDPTLLVPLVGLGYAASRNDERLRTSLPATAAPRGRVDEIDIDAAAGWVRLPPGTVLDPGGLGKGLAADIVASELLAAGAAGALVEVGGDLRVTGTPPADGAWSIAVSEIVPGESSRTLRVLDGGVATSTSRFRTWTFEGRRCHHVLDPGTSRPTSNDVVSCTVVAATGADAEAFTKIAFVLGVEAAIDRLDEAGLAASVTTTDGRHHTTAGWKEESA
jgi:thiamine biosynthesis lipoprotein